MTGDGAARARGGDAMAKRLGWALYWVAVGVAILVASVGVVLMLGADMIGPIICAVIAVLVWGLGRLVRYLLAGEGGRSTDFNNGG